MQLTPASFGPVGLPMLCPLMRTAQFTTKRSLLVLSLSYIGVAKLLPPVAYLLSLFPSALLAQNCMLPAVLCHSMMHKT